MLYQHCESVCCWFLFQMSWVGYLLSWSVCILCDCTSFSTFVFCSDSVLCLSFISVRVQCCFRSTETVQTIRDGEPRMATSTFTQILSSELFFSVHDLILLLILHPPLLSPRCIWHCVRLRVCIHVCVCQCFEWYYVVCKLDDDFQCEVLA